VALVGDAAGYLDALTGEGLSLGFREALALARALRAGELARYEREAAALRRLPEAITRLALALARRPALGARALAALARDPELFARLLGALGCARPARTLARARTARFLVRLALPARG
jgi:flavin-dependent dehydrogenase